MPDVVGNAPVPTALEMVLRRTSIPSGHPFGCTCDGCLASGDAYKARANALRAELAELERETAA